MSETVYMVASRAAADIYRNPDIRWTRGCSGTVFVDCVLSDAIRAMVDGDVLYRCERIDPKNDVLTERPTVTAYVAFDPADGDGQDMWAATTPQAAKACCNKPIFEIEMRAVDVPTPPKTPRETGWIVRKKSLSHAFGANGWFGSPIFFSEPTAKELAFHFDSCAEYVYRDTLEPVAPECS